MCMQIILLAVLIDVSIFMLIDMKKKDFEVKKLNYFNECLQFINKNRSIQHMFINYSIEHNF